MDEKHTNMTGIRLSIVTTLYNSAPYLHKCMESLLHQDIPATAYEILLVNDASPDNSVDIAREYAEKHKNIHVISYDVNKGLAGARQVGVDAACGEYLCFVDPDDYVEENIYGYLLQKVQSEHLDMLRFNYAMVDESDGHVIPKPTGANLAKYDEEVLIGNEFLCHKMGLACYVWAWIYRLDIIKRSGIRFMQGHYFDDIEWLPKIIMQAQRISSVDKIFYYYTQRSGSLLNTQNIEAEKRKLNGSIVVMRGLNDMYQKSSDKMECTWLKKMISHTYLNCLQIIAKCLYGDREKYLLQIKESSSSINCYSMSLGKRSTNLKMLLINISPLIFCYIMHKIKHA